MNYFKKSNFLKLITKNKNLFLVINLIYSFYLLFILHKKTNSNPNIFFIISKGKFWNSYYHIIFSFINSGYNVYIKFDPKLLAGSNEYVHFLLRKQNCRGFFFYPLIKKNKDFFISDFNNKISFYHPNIINITPNLYPKYPLFRLPYMMHPLQYQAGYFSRLDEYRKFERTIGIYFSGNTDVGVYNNSNIVSRFGILTRWQIITTLKKYIHLLDKGNNFTRGLKHSIIINAWEWSTTHSKDLNYRIDTPKWLSKLASCNFFICCPGIIIPFSHNAIEAMSVGTIPVLQYSELFEPPLVNGINCITFNNSNLIDIIIEILNLDEIKIESMRNEVIKYYEQYLTPSSNVEIFYQANKNNNEVYFIDEVHEYGRDS
jgi:hypothetical protein